jgi:hypothetical protein
LFKVENNQYNFYYLSKNIDEMYKRVSKDSNKLLYIEIDTIINAYIYSNIVDKEDLLCSEKIKELFLLSYLFEGIKNKTICNSNINIEEINKIEKYIKYILEDKDIKSIEFGKRNYVAYINSKIQNVLFYIVLKNNGISIKDFEYDISENTYLDELYYINEDVLKEIININKKEILLKDIKNIYVNGRFKDNSNQTNKRIKIINQMFFNNKNILVSNSILKSCYSLNKIMKKNYSVLDKLFLKERKVNECKNIKNINIYKKTLINIFSLYGRKVDIDDIGVLEDNKIDIRDLDINRNHFLIKSQRMFIMAKDIVLEEEKAEMTNKETTLEVIDYFFKEYVNKMLLFIKNEYKKEINKEIFINLKNKYFENIMASLLNIGNYENNDDFYMNVSCRELFYNNGLLDLKDQITQINYYLEKNVYDLLIEFNYLRMVGQKQIWIGYNKHKRVVELNEDKKKYLGFSNEDITKYIFKKVEKKVKNYLMQVIFDNRNLYLDLTKKRRYVEFIHDIVSMIKRNFSEKEIDIVKNEEEINFFNKKNEILNKRFELNYEGNIEIRFPNSNNEMQDWGMELNNCVSSYFQRENTIVLGLLKDNKIKYCIEVRNGVAVQFSGIKNVKISKKSEYNREMLSIIEDIFEIDCGISFEKSNKELDSLNKLKMFSKNRIYKEKEEQKITKKNEELKKKIKELEESYDNNSLKSEINIIDEIIDYVFEKSIKKEKIKDYINYIKRDQFEYEKTGKYYVEYLDKNKTKEIRFPIIEF